VAREDEDAEDSSTSPGGKAHPDQVQAENSWSSMDDQQMSMDEADEPWSRSQAEARFSASDVGMDYCGASPAGRQRTPAPDETPSVGAAPIGRNLNGRSLSGLAPSFDLHDPLVQQFLLYDASVRRAAQAVIGYLRGKGSGKQSYSRSAARMVMRTASFSRDAVFSVSSKSILCKTLAREEVARSTAFQAALREHALRDYAIFLNGLVQGLADLCPATRRMRRSVFLSQYASTADQHLSLCVALMSSEGEPYIDPHAHSSDPHAHSSASETSAASPARGMRRTGSGGSRIFGIAPFPELSQLDVGLDSGEGGGAPACASADTCDAAVAFGSVSSATSSAAALSAEEEAAGDGAAVDEPSESVLAARMTAPAILGSAISELAEVAADEPPVPLTCSPLVAPAILGISIPELSEMSAHELTEPAAAVLVAAPPILGASMPELPEVRSESLEPLLSSRRPKVLFAREVSDVALRGNASTPPMRATGGSPPLTPTADRPPAVTSADAEPSLEPVPLDKLLKRSSSMPSEEAMVGAGNGAQGGDCDCEQSEVEFSLPAGSATPGRKGHYISEPPAFSFRVRGPDYLSNKAKVPCEWAALSLLGVDMRRAKQRQDHVAQGACADKVARLRQMHGGRELLLINFQCPSKSGGNVSVVLWWVMTEQGAADPKFTALWRQMLDSDDDKWRGSRLKLIPCVVEGNFIVRKLVGSRPVLIKAIKTKYHTGPGYLEVDADIKSSSMATNMWRGVESACRGLVVDLGFVIEASAAPCTPHQVVVVDALPTNVYLNMNHPSSALPPRPIPVPSQGP
jgi:hypothetical protein